MKIATEAGMVLNYKQTNIVHWTFNIYNMYDI